MWVIPNYLRQSEYRVRANQGLDNVMNQDTVPGYCLAMVLKPPETGNNAADDWDFLQNGHPWGGETGWTYAAFQGSGPIARKKVAGWKVPAPTS